jgi:hypothetical protein
MENNKKIKYIQTDILETELNFSGGQKEDAKLLTEIDIINKFTAKDANELIG